MRARIGIVDERWNGASVMVAHVFPLDTDDALAWDAARRLLRPLAPGVSRDELRAYLAEPGPPTLCGENARPHFLPGGGRYVVPVKGWRWCPTCAKFDEFPRLP